MTLMNPVLQVLPDQPETTVGNHSTEWTLINQSLQERFPATVPAWEGQG